MFLTIQKVMFDFRESIFTGDVIQISKTLIATEREYSRVMSDCLTETKYLPTAAEVMRSITPPVLATLVITRGTDGKTQRQIASEVGCARSTISKYFQTLENLPLPVINKQGHSVVVTEHGDSLIKMYQSLLSEFEIDIESVDWATDEISIVEDALSPLHRFRSDTPFLVLAGLVDLSTETQHEVWIDDLIVWIENNGHETISHMSKQHFEQILDNLEQHETIRRNDEEIKLTQKGQRQGNLLRDLIVNIFSEHSIKKEQRLQTDSGALDSDPPVTVSPQQPSKTINTGTKSERIAEPDAANAFRGGSFEDIVSGAEVGPVVCVDFGDELRPIGSIRGEETDTLAENLHAIASQLEEIRDSPDQILSAGVYRCLVYDDEILPLRDDWQSLRPLQRMSKD